MKNPFRVFTKWELLIWFGSAAAVTASFLLSPGNDYLTLTAALIGVTALIFVAKGMVLGQILTVVFSVFYGIVSYWLGHYGEMITYLCMTSPIAVLSVISWVRHPYQESSEVEVNRVSKRQVLVMAVLAVMVTAIFYVILGAMGNVNLIVSTVSVTTSFLASFLTFLRSPYYGIGYGANDIVLIVLWTLAAVNDINYLPMVICFVMFLVNDIYGFVNWKKMQKRQLYMAE